MVSTAIVKLQRTSSSKAALVANLIRGKKNKWSNNYFK